MCFFESSVWLVRCCQCIDMYVRLSRNKLNLSISRFQRDALGFRLGEVRRDGTAHTIAPYYGLVEQTMG